MLSTSEIILEYVCPAAGLVCGNWMFLAPLSDVRKSARAGVLAPDLNPAPWAFMLGNTLGWVGYGLLRGNWFIFFANAPGFLLSIYFNLTAIKLLYKAARENEAAQDDSTRVALLVAGDHQQQRHDKDQDQNATIKEEAAVDSSTATQLPPLSTPMTDPSSPSSPPPAASATVSSDKAHRHQARLDWQERLVMVMIVSWLVVLSGIVAAADRVSTDVRVAILGLTVNANLVVFYAAPLGAIRRVLATRQCDLHGPTMVRNTANGVFWTAYGVAVLDWYVAVPNGLGALLGGVQMALWVVFPRQPPPPPPQQQPQPSPRAANESSNATRDGADPTRTTLEANNVTEP